MSTPTPAAMKHAPSQQGRTPSGQHGQGRTPSHFPVATPPVSTPFSVAAQAVLSPHGGHRSSPLQHLKKSPAAMGGLTGQQALHSLNFDSPSTAAAMSALDLGGSFDMTLDGVGGLESVGAAFASEEEKLRRLDYIIKLLNEKKGMVSEAGLERLAQRLGMELLAEEHSTPDGRKTKTLAMAGSAVALDIVLDNNIVQNATLSYHGSAASVSKHIDAASQILLKDLQLEPGQSPLTKTLERFATNFERLAKLDKLSIVPGLDCHEALAGIYSSLERLHTWDTEQLHKEPEMAGKSEQLISNLVMCRMHGNPVMHERGQVGLALQYWKSARHLTSTESADKDDGGIWSMLFGCAAIDGVGLPPVRVSETWLSKDIIKQDVMTDMTNPLLDWQEPDDVSLPLSDENKDAGIDLLQADLSTTRVPRVMFTITFDPPMILPQNEWARLYVFAGVEPPNIHASGDFGGVGGRVPATFDTLFFPVVPGSRSDPSEARTIVRRRVVEVPLPGGGTKDQEMTVVRRSHQSNIYIYRPVYSQEMTEMPFAHPRQIMDMLPLLRQYAFLATLLRNSFGDEEMTSSTTTTAEAVRSDKGTADNGSETRTLQSQLEAFMASGQQQGRAAGKHAVTRLDGSENSEQAEEELVDLVVDVILKVHPSPHLQVVFPLRGTTANVSFRVAEGGFVVILDENVLGPVTNGSAGEEEGGKEGGGGGGKEGGGKGKGKVTREGLATALERLEDVNKWAEWIRTRL